MLLLLLLHVVTYGIAAVGVRWWIAIEGAICDMIYLI